MKILVTGAHGMVGSNFREHPRAKEHELLTPTRSQLDLFDQIAISNYLKTYRPELIVHAAGRVGGLQANIQDPVAFLQDNLRLNLNLLEAARAAGIKRVINLGSSCIYPRDHQTPLTEELVLTGPLESTNEGYAIAKIAALKYCEYLRRSQPEFVYKTLLPCNLYGRYDKFDPSSSHLIPAIIHKIHHAKKRGESVVIWGDGTARREFMNAADLADFLFFAIERLDHLPGELNIGIGLDHSVNDYYQIVAKAIGYTGGFRHDLNRPVGMKRKLLSVKKCEAVGWHAKISLEAGIRQAYEYYLTLDLAK